MSICIGFIIIFLSELHRSKLCNHDEFVSCTRPLRGLVNFGLNFMATKNLEVLCNNLKSSQECIRKYSVNCAELRKKLRFDLLFYGTDEMVQDLCWNGTFQESYYRYSTCIRKVVVHHKSCFKRYRETMRIVHQEDDGEKYDEEGLKTYCSIVSSDDDRRNDQICCTLREYMNCSTIKVRSYCSGEAADFAMVFMEKIFAAMINAYCYNKFSDYNEEDEESSVMSVFGSAVFLILCVALSVVALCYTLIKIKIRHVI